MKPPREAVLVRWVDSASCHGWLKLDEISAEACEIETVGLLVRRNADVITVTTSISDEGLVNDPITIPMKSVRDIQTLVLPPP